jgi:hypothetical protein
MGKHTLLAVAAAASVFEAQLKARFGLIADAGVNTGVAAGNTDSVADRKEEDIGC